MKDLKSILSESVNKTESEFNAQCVAKKDCKIESVYSTKDDFNSLGDVSAWIVNTNHKSYNGKDIEDWNKRNFLSFICDKYRGIFLKEISIPIAHGMFEMATLFDLVQGRVKCSDRDVNTAVYKYLIWYFDQYIYTVIEKFNYWKIKYVNHPQAISSFVNSLLSENQNQSFSTNIKKNKINKNLLDIAYRGTAEKFLSMYGVVIVYGYLQTCQHLSADASGVYIKDGMIKLCKSGLFTLEQIIDISNQYSPYPEKFKRLNMDELFFSLKNHFGMAISKLRVDLK